MERKRTKHSIRKIAVITAAAVMALGTTVFAAGKISQYVSNGTNIPVYRDFPAADQVEKDYGFSPLMLEGFSNGYEFSAGYDSDTTSQDDEGNVIESFKDLDFAYKSGDDMVDLTMNTASNPSELDETKSESVMLGDVQAYYESYVNKCVPPDYEMTEEDKAAEADGSIVFSVGTPEVMVQTNQFVSFSKAGVNYLLYYSGENLEKEDLIGMAEELVNQQ